MSADVIERVVQTLRGLPDSYQQLVLQFVSELGQGTNLTTRGVRHGLNPAVQMRDGALVFAGTIDTDENWLARIRDERAAELLGIASGQ